MMIQEIKIIDLDLDKTRLSDGDSALRHMFLKLSHRPDSTWKQIFNDERKTPKHNMWREAWVEGDYIVVNCVPEEIRQYHLKDLKENVSKVNEKYAVYLENLTKDSEIKAKVLSEEQEYLINLKKGLNFD